MKTGFCTVPGSLLIAGEYLITEDGGTGLALAGGCRASLRTEVEASGEDSLVMEGFWAGGSERWTPEEPESQTLGFSVWKEYRKQTGIQFSGQRRKISVDTGEFYSLSGQKLGFGSSAAAAVLYTRGLFFGPPPLEKISRCALEAHRNWQGGRGSGYDILTSVNGGAGIFTGGAEPLWTPLRWPDIYRMWIIQGRRSVKSPDAVKKYRLWKDAAGEHSRTVLGEMKKNIAELARILQSGGKPDTRGFLEILHSLSLSGIGLGELIGVPARPVFPEGFPLPLYRPGALAAKCLGAGDETILLAAVPDGLSKAELSFIGTLEEQGLAVVLNPEIDGLINDESE